jgi:hypothetical protein
MTLTPVTAGFNLGGEAPSPRPSPGGRGVDYSSRMNLRGFCGMPLTRTS